MINRTCSIDGCERKLLARTWCSTHYKRWRTTGTTDLQIHKPQPCSIGGCTDVAKKRGWCGTHYRRWQRHGSPQADVHVKQFKTPVVDGMKICATCRTSLPLTGFNKHMHGSGGVNNVCRECQREKSRQWRESNPTYWQVWQKANPDKVLAIVHKRRAQRLSREHEEIDRDAVFARDSFECKLCGVALDMSARFPDPWFPTIDHIIPLNKGGHHLYSNVQAAHFRCNTVKGDRLLA